MAKEYSISKATGRCCRCEKVLAVGEEFVATVRLNEQDEFAREDYCLACWEARGDSTEGLFGLWRSTIAAPQEKKKLLVDDELLINFFERLADAREDAKVSFRFVLALVLMRKKLLVYDGMETQDGLEIWKMRFKASQQIHRVVNPHLDEDKIAEVCGHLGAILEGEL